MYNILISAALITVVQLQKTLTDYFQYSWKMFVRLSLLPLIFKEAYQHVLIPDLMHKNVNFSWQIVWNIANIILTK